MKPVTGSLQIKKDKYYAVLNLRDENNKRKVKWVCIDGLSVKGNKTAAKKRLAEIISEYSQKEVYEKAVKSKSQRVKDEIAEMTVYEYVKYWLDSYQVNIQKITYGHYVMQVEGRIKKAFSKIKLNEITGDEINDFYNSILREGCKANTAIHYHAMLRTAFQHAVKRRIIPSNPCDQADRPKKNQFMAGYYSVDELRELLELTADDPMQIVILLAAYYGLRRSEVLGIKWNAVDFKEKKLTISHKITEEFIDGKTKLVGYDQMKTKSSYRTLPLIPEVEEALLREKEKQEEMKKIMRRAYNKEFQEYVCVDKLGKLISPNYVTSHFKVILQNNNLRKIRFHDLRHTCASVMLANGVQMKQIQDWLGHSTFATTADIYSHLDYKSKEESASVMSALLK